MKLRAYSATQLRLVYRIISDKNSRTLWPDASSRVSEASRNMSTAHERRLKGADVVRDALARALFDAPPAVIEDLASSALSGRARRCNGPILLARRVAAELEHAGWVLKSARDCPADASAAKRRLALQDHIHFGITSATFAARSVLVSTDHVASHAARDAVAEKIHETFNLMRVVLGKQKPTP